MASNLVAYDESDSDEEMDQSAAITEQNILTGNIHEDNNLPKPSVKELKLAELAGREKTNLKKPELLTSISHRKNGKIMIGIPSLVDVTFIFCHFHIDC